MLLFPFSFILTIILVFSPKIPRNVRLRLFQRSLLPNAKFVRNVCHSKRDRNYAHRCWKPQLNSGLCAMCWSVAVFASDNIAVESALWNREVAKIAGRTSISTCCVSRLIGLERVRVTQWNKKRL